MQRLVCASDSHLAGLCAAVQAGLELRLPCFLYACNHECLPYMIACFDFNFALPCVLDLVSKVTVWNEDL